MAMEILLVVEKITSNDPNVVLFDAIEQDMRNYEAPAEKFFCDGDLRNCYNERYPTGIALSDLVEKHAGSRLIILGTGHRMTNPVTGEVFDWAAELKGVFHSCAIFTPIPKKEWGLYELKLSRFFTLKPIK